MFKQFLAKQKLDFVFDLKKKKKFRILGFMLLLEVVSNFFHIRIFENLEAQASPKSN